MSETGDNVSMTSMEGSNMSRQLIIGLTVGATCMVLWAIIVFAILVARHNAKKDRGRRDEERRRSQSSRAGASHLPQSDSRTRDYGHNSGFHHLAFSTRSFSSGLPSPGTGMNLGPSMMPLHSYHEPFLDKHSSQMSISGLTSVSSSRGSGRPALVPFRTSNLPHSDNVHYGYDGRIESLDSRHHSVEGSENKRNTFFEENIYSKISSIGSKGNSKSSSPHRKISPPSRKISPTSRKVSSSSSSAQEYELRAKQKRYKPRPMSPTRQTDFSWNLKQGDAIPGPSSEHLVHHSPANLPITHMSYHGDSMPSVFPANKHGGGFVPELARSVSQEEASIFFEEEDQEDVWLPRNSPRAQRIMSESSLMGYNTALSDGSSSSGSERRRRSNIPSFVAAEYDRIFEPSASITIHRSKAFDHSVESSTLDFQLPDSGYYDDVLHKSSAVR